MPSPRSVFPISFRSAKRHALVSLVLARGTGRLAGVALGAGLLAAGSPPPSGAQEGAAPQRVALEEMPDSFFQWQDAGGYYWQATANGALTSAGTQYLQSGLNLLVEGEVFAPSAASILSPESDAPWPEIELRESRDGYDMRRLLRFDRERQAVRVLDTFSAAAGVSRSLRVDLRTTYPFGWQTLHGTDGALLSSDPALILDGDHDGLVVRFSPTDGRHDTVILTGRGASAGPPRLASSGNQRQLTLSYDLELRAGESVSLLHWISQRNLPEAGEFPAALSDLVQRGRLVRPQLSSGEAALVANFPREAIPEEAVPTAQLRSLVALNEETGRLGIQRRSADLLWVSASNQVAGTVEADGDLVVQAAHLGEQSVSLTEVAALRGGGGVGRRHLVYLRDGRVLAGSFSAEGLRFVPEGAGSIQELAPEALNLLLTRTAPGDGGAPEGAAAFLRLIDGTVLALSQGAGIDLDTVSILGFREVPLSEIREIGYLSRPVPCHRIVKEDGSRLSLVLSRDQLSLDLAGGGGVELSTEWIDRFWRVGSGGWTVRVVDDDWLSFSEVPEGLGIDEGFLLTGNQLLAGRLSEGTLRLRVDEVRVEVEYAAVRSLRRKLETTEGGRPLFTLERSDGEVLEGVVESPVVEVVLGGDVHQVAVARLLDYRSIPQ